MGFFQLLVRTYLFFIGILPNEADKRKEKYLFCGLIVCNAILITGIIIGVFASSESGYRTETLSHLFSVSFVLGIQCTSYANRDLLVDLSSKLCGNFGSNLEHDITPEAEIRVKKALRPFSIFISFLIVSVTVPFLRLIFQDVDYNDPDLYAVPYWFAHGNVTSLAEYLTMVVSLNFLSMIDILTFWCFTIFLISVMFTFRLHMDEINKRIKSYADQKLAEIPKDNFRRLDQKWKKFMEEYESHKIEEFRYLIRYQQLYYSYVKVFIKYLQWPFSLMVAWFTFTTVLVTYAYFQGDGNVAFIIRIMALNANLLAAFFIFCNIAEITSHQGEMLLNSFYMMPWHTIPMSQRKMLVVAMTQCHENFNIKAFKMYTINLNLHIRAIRLVFSMANILLVFDRK